VLQVMPLRSPTISRLTVERPTHGFSGGVREGSTAETDLEGVGILQCSAAGRRYFTSFETLPLPFALDVRSAKCRFSRHNPPFTFLANRLRQLSHKTDCAFVLACIDELNRTFLIVVSPYLSAHFGEGGGAGWMARPTGVPPQFRKPTPAPVATQFIGRGADQA
jgi:hypothetical protein